MKLVWDNDRQIPSAKNTKSHSRHYVPSGGSIASEDKFIQHYHHLFTLGAWQMQQNCADTLTSDYQRRIAIAKRMAKRLQDV